MSSGEVRGLIKDLNTRKQALINERAAFGALSFELQHALAGAEKRDRVKVLKHVTEFKLSLVAMGPIPHARGLIVKQLPPKIEGPTIMGEWHKATEAIREVAGQIAEVLVKIQTEDEYLQSELREAEKAYQTGLHRLG